MKAFVDSGAWIALIYEGDRNHSRARAHYRRLLAKRVSLLTSNYVLAETYTWLRYHASHRRALEVHRLVTAAQQQNLLRLLWVERIVADEAWLLFEQYDDQVLSITDCTSFVLARQTGAEEVFAFDQHFAMMGFVVRP